MSDLAPHADSPRRPALDAPPTPIAPPPRIASAHARWIPFDKLLGQPLLCSDIISARAHRYCLRRTRQFVPLPIRRRGSSQRRSCVRRFTPNTTRPPHFVCLTAVHIARLLCAREGRGVGPTFCRLRWRCASCCAISAATRTTRSIRAVIFCVCARSVVSVGAPLARAPINNFYSRRGARRRAARRPTWIEP